MVCLLNTKICFPYNEELSQICGENVYSVPQIETIIGFANQYNLNIIPLIQTFGHLEFCLKTQLL